MQLPADLLLPKSIKALLDDRRAYSRWWTSRYGASHPDAASALTTLSEVGEDILEPGTHSVNPDVCS
jgi:hypothetical protein